MTFIFSYKSRIFVDTKGMFHRAVINSSPYAPSFTVCKAGYGGASCTICAAGSYKSVTGSGSCTPCSGGLTTLSAGATDSSLCGKNLLCNFH